VRFLVGQDEEKAIVRLNQKLAANVDLIPPGASHPLVKPRSIDDVPILALTFWSKRYGDFELRRIAAQVDDTIKQTPDVSAVALIGGQRREISISLNQARLAAYNLSPVQVVGALGLSNRRLPAGQFASGNQQFLMEAGQFLRTADDVRRVVAGVANDKTVLVRDVAEVSDGGEEPSQYVRYSDGKGSFPAVTMAVSKRKGTNAVTVTEEVLGRVERLRGSVIPSDVEMTVTRNYGDTAKEKSNELLYHMLIAVISVSILIAFALGLREAVISIGLQDAPRLIKAYQTLGVLLPSANIKLLEEASAQLFDRFWGMSMNELRNIRHDEMMKFGLQFRELMLNMPFQLPENLLLLGRTLGILSGMCTGLNPDFNLWQQLAPYAKKLTEGEGGSAFDVFLNEAGELLKTLITIPGRTERVLGRIERGELNVQVPLMNIQISYLERSMNRLTGGIVFLGLLVSGAMLYDEHTLLAQGFMGGAAIALFYTLFLARGKRPFR
jgi:hypothetical protein